MATKVETLSLRNLTPAQKLRSLKALEAIQRGEIEVRITCGDCGSTSVEHTTEMGKEVFHCLACSRNTPIEAAHAIRRQKLKAIIVHGGDPRKKVL